MVLGGNFVVVPMTGNSAIRGMGDTRTPGLVMILAALINSVMDPLLIFGIGPFPRMGVAGAATATVAARGVTFCTAIYILGFRDRVFSLSRAGRKRLGDSWKEILYVGVPNILTRIIIPLGAGIVTGLIARHGRESVAGFGVATRLEMFALLFIQALVAILPVFIGQNWGAGRKDRVARGLRLSEKYSLGVGLLLYILLALFARPLGIIFNRDPLVVDIIVLYLRIVPVSYGLRGIMLLGVTSLNVLKKPVQSAVLTLVQMFVLYIPLAFTGSLLFGPPGIFSALALSYIVVGPVAHIVNKKYIEKLPCG